jgi:ATP-dependent Clp protease adaptor protein ClpS
MNSIRFEIQTQEQLDLDVLVEEAPILDLIIYNDDVNTFDHVIRCLIEICEHEEIQAEQCTMLIHYKGKCSVKRADYETLEPMCTALLDKGLSAKIE